jgi:site-specific recombinase
MYPPNVLEAKAKEAAADAKQALIMSIIGIFCFGFILGFIAFRKASSALETIDLYQVAQDKRGIATVAKVLGTVDIALWILGLIARFTILSR